MAGMPVQIRAKVPQLPQRLRGVLPALEQNVRRVVAASGTTVLTHAKERAPVETGRLKQSLTLRFPSEQHGWAVIVGTNVLSPGGYNYPLRQETDDTLRHSPPVIRRHRSDTRSGYGETIGRRGGQAHFLGQSLAEEKAHFGAQIGVAVQNAWKEATR